MALGWQQGESRTQTQTREGATWGIVRLAAVAGRGEVHSVAGGAGPLLRSDRRLPGFSIVESLTISRQRIIDHGEVFTPPGLVRDMLDLVAHECERIDSRFLEPACGNGNFLAEVLRRKLLTVSKRQAKNAVAWQRDAIVAVCSIYGIDLLGDNIAACRERLLGVVADAAMQISGEPLPDPVARVVAFVLSRNIVQADALTLRTPENKPIVFSEWSPVNGSMIKRRDFTYCALVDHGRIASLPLFSDLGEEVFVPQPVGERPVCHYLQLPDAEGAT